MQALTSSNGQTSQRFTEYVLSLLLVALLVITALMVLGPVTDRVFAQDSGFSTAGAGVNQAGCAADFAAWCSSISGTAVCSEQSSVCSTGQ